MAQSVVVTLTTPNAEDNVEQQEFSHLADGSLELNTSILEQSFTVCVKNLKSRKAL